MCLGNLDTQVLSAQDTEREFNNSRNDTTRVLHRRHNPMTLAIHLRNHRARRQIVVTISDIDLSGANCTLGHARRPNPNTGLSPSSSFPYTDQIGTRTGARTRRDHARSACPPPLRRDHPIPHSASASQYFQPLLNPGVYMSMATRIAGAHDEVNTRESPEQLHSGWGINLRTGK